MAPNPFIDPITRTPRAPGSLPPRPATNSSLPGGISVGRSGVAVPGRTTTPDLTPAQAEAKANAQAKIEAANNAPPGAKGWWNAPGGKAPVSATNPKDQISAMQTFLKNRGYNITVDGVRGPQTNAAVLAFHKGVVPAKFNAGNGTTPHGNPGDTASAVTPGGGASNASKTTSSAYTKPSTGNPTLDALIDPTAYATGLTNAKYNPQIQELVRQMALGGAQGKMNQGDIAAWYKQLGDLANSTGTADASAAKNAIAGYDTAGQAAGHLFGDSGGDQAYHDINKALIGANAEDQGAFDNHMKAILAAQGVQAATNQQTTDANKASGLASQLVSLRGAKGAEYGANYQTGLQNRTQQEAAQQSLALARQLAPAQVATAQANAVTAETNALNAGKMANANLKLINAQVKKATAAANASGGWNLTRPNDRGQLTSALRTGLQTKLGGFRIDPISAANNLQQSLAQAGLQNDPQAKAIADSLLQETLTNAHSKHLWGGFKWNGTKVVRSGSHFDPKTGKLVKGQNG